MERPRQQLPYEADSERDLIDELFELARDLALDGRGEIGLRLANAVQRLAEILPASRPWETAPQEVLDTNTQPMLVEEDDRESADDEKTDEALDAERVLKLERQQAIDAAHFASLAALYSERGENGPAFECIQLAKDKGPTQPLPYKLLGTLLARQRNWSAAAAELISARRFDPFDLEVAELLGRVEYERKDFVAALAATVDAYLLLPHMDGDAPSRLRRRIRTLKRLLGWTSAELISLFHERREQLTVAFDRLQWRRDLFLQEKGLLDGSPLFSGAPRPDRAPRLDLAGRLRHIKMLHRLPDEAIFRLTRVTREESYQPGDILFDVGDPGRDLFFLESGELVLWRDTPHGEFVVHRMEPGELLGEIGFVVDSGRSTRVTAASEARVLRIEATALDRLLEEQADLAAQLYASLWHALAQKLRGANLRLNEAFDDAEPSTRRPEPVPAPATPAPVGLARKVELFREQGLTRRELLTLATFSREISVPTGTYLFREGDPGRELYIVMDGKIRISRFIPGGGEEALEVVSRGGFFGEVALVDGGPRSADAQAHEGPTTVLALDQATVQDVLSMDPHASLDFLRLLCRILAARLRELDEKLVLWQILSNVPGSSSPAPGSGRAG